VTFHAAEGGKHYNPPAHCSQVFEESRKPRELPNQTLLPQLCI